MKIIKTVFFSLSLVAAISFISCGSNKPAEVAVDLEAPVAEAEIVAEENSDEVVADVVVAETSQTAIPEDEGTGKKKNYIGWIDASGRDVDFKDGIIRLRGKPRLGTYNIGLLTENGKYVPVLSTRDEYTSSFFSLKVDKKIYKLSADANTMTMAKKTDTGIKLLYRIANVADVEIDFSSLNSIKNGDIDLIKVTATVTNLGPKKVQFALKSVLDTILGESTQYHFYNADDSAVKSEVMYRNVQDVKWVTSKNKNGQMLVFLTGADISPLEYVALANYSTLDIKNWEPEMLSYRAFDTVLSYNNSAIGLAWPAKNLRVEESVSFVYYIGFASESEKPVCTKYIWPNGIEQAVEAANEVVTPVPTKDEVAKLPETTAIVPEVPSTPAVETISPVTVINPVPEEPKIVSNVKFDVSKLTKEQLSPEYIQNLLDRISALEEDDTTINRDELLQLNAELDAILEVLRQ